MGGKVQRHHRAAFGVGIDDSLEVLASSQEILDFPVVGDFFKQSMENVRTVREGETLVFPLTAPKGLVYLQKNRKNDPYRDLIPRVLYEQNSSKKAPSFPC